MQILPDWHRIYKQGSLIESDLTGFKFKGPGLYLSPGCTILVLGEGPTDCFPSTHQGPFRVYVYNVDVEETIFRRVAPLRSDTR